MTFHSRSRGRLLAVALALLMALGLAALAAPVSAQEGDTLTIQLAPENDSGVSGTAVLTADGDQTVIEISLVGSEAGYEGHAFDSTCDDHRSATVFHAIEAVDENGESTSTVDAPFDEITSGDFWLHMHRPAGERGEGVACGQILGSSAVGGGTLPGAGIGPGESNGLGSWLLLAMALVAFALFGTSRVVRPHSARSRTK